jgi:hypothetical protein
MGIPKQPRAHYQLQLLTGVYRPKQVRLSVCSRRVDGEAVRTGMIHEYFGERVRRTGRSPGRASPASGTARVMRSVCRTASCDTGSGLEQYELQGYRLVISNEVQL